MKELNKREITMAYHNEDIAACMNDNCPKRLTCLRWQIGTKLRGEYGIRRGNEIIRSMAEAKDGCKYPLWGRD